MGTNGAKRDAILAKVKYDFERDSGAVFSLKTSLRNDLTRLFSAEDRRDMANREITSARKRIADLRAAIKELSK